MAAPTAGMHFTDPLLEKLGKKGVINAPILLHIGLGTFKPILVEDLTRHNMDSEYYQVPPDTATIINKAKEKRKRITAVGTSTVRTLETVIVSGFQITSKEGWTDKFIYPPYDFKMVDRLITNFHQPQSTLMLLVSAFANKDFIMRAYEEAIKNGFSMDLWIEPYQISQYLSDKFKINAYNILYHINDNYRKNILNTSINLYESKTYSKHNIDIVSLLFQRHFERSRLPVVIDDGIYSYCICEIKNDELTISDPHKTNDNEVLIKKPMSFLWESFWMIYFPLNY